MTSRKPILAAVQTMAPVEETPVIVGDMDVETGFVAVPSQPVLDEAAEYRADMISRLDDTNAKLHAVQSTIIAQRPAGALRP